MSILLVDSKIGSDVQLRTVFEGQGFEHLDICKSIAQAQSFLETKQTATGIDKINLIIIDSEVDDGDGYQLCRDIRNTELGQNVYIMILVSSENNSAAIEKVKHSGADDFAVKPYNSAGFLKHLLVFAHKKAVLLVEDDPTIRQLVMSLLYKKDIELMVADDGLYAYNLINSIVPPKVVFLDIGLPNMNGVKLVEHIRSKPLWRNTPIVMLTASTDADDVKKSLGAGANEYIVKPFQIDDFVKRVAKYFSDGRD